jgi:hypothetical protein
MAGSRFQCVLGTGTECWGTEWGRRKEEPRRNRREMIGQPPEATHRRPVGRDMEMKTQAGGWEQCILRAATAATTASA